MKHTSKLLALLAVALVLPSGACNDPLKVSIPTIVPPGSLTDSAALGTLRAGAIGDFSIAFSGDHPDGSGGTGEGVIMYGGLLADEWIDSETFPTRIEVDARTTQVTNADVDLWYRLLHQARNAAEKAAAQYAALSPNDAGHAEVLNLAGYTYLFFAETYCSGVPGSQVNAGAGAIPDGVPLTTQQLTDTAIARFNEALAVAAGVTNATLRQAMTNLARVGKARALVDKGDFATADTTVAPVPTNFAYLSEHSEISTFENNGVFNGNAFDRRYSVADREGGTGFPFRSVADKRTPVRRRGGSGKGIAGPTPPDNNIPVSGPKAPVPPATRGESRPTPARGVAPPRRRSERRTNPAHVRVVHNEESFRKQRRDRRFTHDHLSERSIEVATPLHICCPPCVDDLPVELMRMKVEAAPGARVAVED